MSKLKSRSTTPTTPTPNTSTTTNPNPSTSSRQPHDAQPSTSIPSDSHRHSTLVIRDPTPGPSTRRTRRHSSSSSTGSAPMAKRLRRDSPRLSSPESTDSQGGMADTEDMAQEQHAGNGPYPSTAPAAQPKKKRTRTLTTPHQATVLHALLAQSRFPSTAMREEVGRSIGLSARKVQIWFQNQRQKARKPQSQPYSQRGIATPPLPRPPKYGPFPSAPETAGRMQFRLNQAGELSPMSHIERGPAGSITELMARFTDERATMEGREHAQQHPRYASENTLPEPFEPLKGPGMPGSSKHPDTSPRTSPTSRQFLHRRRPSSQGTLGRAGSPPRPSQWTLPSLGSTLRPRDPSLTLPPIDFSLPPVDTSMLPTIGSASSLTGSSHRSSIPFPGSATSFTNRSRSSSPPETLFAHRPPPLDLPAEGTSSVFLSGRAPGSASGSVLPPPFALQPRPQWEADHFSPSPSSWSRPSSQAAKTPPPTGQEVQQAGDTVTIAAPAGDQNEDASPTTRAGRFDPVREAMQ